MIANVKVTWGEFIMGYYDVEIEPTDTAESPGVIEQVTEFMNGEEFDLIEIVSKQ